MTRWLAHTFGERCIAVERRLVTFGSGQQAWVPQRHVFVSDAGSTRGQKSMLPYIPSGAVETEIMQSDFEEAYREAV